MKIHNKRELQNIAINHSADIDCIDFMKTYRKCISKSYCFFTTDTTSTADNTLIFRKNLLDSLMTLIGKTKNFDSKIKANQAQYYFDKEAAKIFALLFKELDKYKDLGYELEVKI